MVNDCYFNAGSFIRGSEHHAEIDSTNNRALELCQSESLAVPYLILADRQISGRGRGTNWWWSSDGALLFSLIIGANEFGLPESRWPQISLTVGAAVCETLAATFDRGDRAPNPDFADSERNAIGLKWPNDVWLNGRKACGILVEVPPARHGRLVIGVGLNVNNSFETAPAELQALATSLRDETGEMFDREVILSALLRQFDADLRRLVANDESLLERCRSRCVLRGRHVTIETGTQSITGVCLGIADDGALRLQTPHEERRFYGGVVRKVIHR